MDSDVSSNGITKPTMKKCEFCDNTLSVLLEFDDGLECDPTTDKWTCSQCVGHPTYVFRDEIHTSTEFWFAREFDEQGHNIMSLVLRQNFATALKYHHKNSPPTFVLEILECRSPMRYKPIYRSNGGHNLTPQNAKQKLETILIFR